MDMTNYEKFKNEIEALGYNFGVTKVQEICSCQTMECVDCIFNINEERICVPTKVQWLYKEAQEDFSITAQEKDFVSVLWEDNYIARDYSGQLFIYSQKPVQLSNCWVLEDDGIDDNVFNICPDFFKFITCESNKWWSITENASKRIGEFKWNGGIYIKLYFGMKMKSI